ncbi:AAE1, partial [Symbiodinium microadriaticum]
VRADAIYAAIAEHGVTHLCGAPVVMQMMLNATENEKRPFEQQVKFMTAAAPPPASVLAAMADEGIEVTHVYGLTEVYGPAVVCAWHADWDGLDIEQQAALKARQGVSYPVLDGLMVADAETLAPVPRDGQTLGESKEALAHDLFKQVYVRYAEDLQAIAARKAPFRETWAAVVAQLCRAFDEDADAFRFLLITQHDHLGEISARLESPVEVVRALMAEAIAAGEISVPDADLATSLGLGAIVQAAIFVLYGQLQGPLSAWTVEIQARSLKALI